MNKIYCHFDHYKVKKKVTKHSIEQIQSIIDYQKQKTVLADVQIILISICWQTTNV